MHGTGVSTVTAYTAHREWATRPPDERFDSVQALYEAARTRRLRTEERRIETVDFGTEAVSDDVLALRDPSGRPAALTHWSFEQLAAIAGAPPKYLRTLPASIASAAHQPRAAAAATGTASAVHRSGRTVDRACDHIASLRTGPPRRAGRPGARPDVQPPRLALAARLQGRRIRR